MSRKLYVGNLPYSVTEEKLQEIFSEFGTVTSAKIVKENGRSKGFGFVEMTTEQEAILAAEQLNGKQIDGRTIKVDLAREKEFKPRPRGGERRGPGGSSSKGGFRF